MSDDFDFCASIFGVPVVDVPPSCITCVVVMTTISLIETVFGQVYERIKAPLLTLVSSGSPEQSYAVLSHLHLLVMRAPFIFASDYKHFYCQYNEPSYVKKLKLEMLTAVANESNTYEIGKK